jgi:hypothetical protein
MLYNICREALSLQDTRRRQMRWYTSQQCCHDDTQRTVRCTQDSAQHTAGVGCDGRIIKYTYDEYCDMLWTLGTCNTPASTAAREYALYYLGRCHPDAEVFRGLEQRLRGTGSVIPTAHVNTGRPRTLRTPANEDTMIVVGGTRAVEKLKRYRTRIRTINCIHKRSAHLFPGDSPSPMQFCEWLRNEHTANELFLYNVLCAGEAYFSREVCSPSTSHFWARCNPYAIQERGNQVSVSVWTWIVGNTVVDSYLLPVRLTSKDFVIFWKLFYWDCFKMCL